jgi:hypothetical protein
MVHACLDLAEEGALHKTPMTMEDWAKGLDAFLKFAEGDILQHSGMGCADRAKAHAQRKFEKYRIMQDQLCENDFDRRVKQISSAEMNYPKFGKALKKIPGLSA